MGALAQKWFWATTVALLAALTAVQVMSVSGDSETADEGEHLAAGYSYWKTGDFRLNPEHPPLGKLLCALPLLALDLQFPAAEESGLKKSAHALAKEFLYKNRVPVDTMLFRARLITILLTVLLGLVMAVWTRRRFGAEAALFSLLLLCFDPNVIAYGRFVTTDLIAALTLFLACLTWGRYLVTDTRRDLAIAGLALGFALVSKFSALLLLPIYVALYVIRWWQERAGHSVRHLVKALAVTGLISFVVIFAAYGFEVRTLVSIKGNESSGRVTERLRSSTSGLAGFLARHDSFLAPVDYAAEKVPVPAVSYLIGMASVMLHSAEGHRAYLLGQTSERGWWYYFPVAFLVKTPLETLALLGLAAFLAARRPAPPRRLRELSFVWLVITVPPVIYFGLSMTSRINIGVRHILPVYPFLFVFIGAVLFGRNWSQLRWAHWAAAALAGSLLVVSLKTFPNYVTFFSTAIGGGGSGPKYLLDSNLDWGQDTKRLKAYLDKERIEPVCLIGFESAALDAYEFRYQLPHAGDGGEQGLDCVLAINANQLYGRPEYRWLQSRTPRTRVGGSIFVYDFRRHP